MMQKVLVKYLKDLGMMLFLTQTEIQKNRIHKVQLIITPMPSQSLENA